MIRKDQIWVQRGQWLSLESEEEYREKFEYRLLKLTSSAPRTASLWPQRSSNGTWGNFHIKLYILVRRNWLVNSINGRLYWNCWDFTEVLKLCLISHQHNPSVNSKSEVRARVQTSRSFWTPPNDFHTRVLNSSWSLFAYSWGRLKAFPCWKSTAQTLAKNLLDFMFPTGGIPTCLSHEGLPILLKLLLKFFKALPLTQNLQER